MAKLLSLLAAIGFLAGCDDKKKDVATEPSQDATAGYDYSNGTTGTYGPETAGTDSTYASTTTDGSYGSSGGYSASSGGYTATYTTMPNTTYDAASESVAATPPPAGGRHVVAKGETLYSLARLYYNDQRRWRDIYEANRGAIRDPNRLRVGQELMIP
jgi:5'-nucleotidase